METNLKSLGLLIVFLIAIGGAATAGAGGPDSGFFIGGGGYVQFIKGTGTWADYDFEIDTPLSEEEGTPIGFAWTDKLLLGIKPMLGYRLNRQLELQVGYGLNITKSSQQSDTQYDTYTTYEQGFSLAWQQRSLEIIGVFYPDSDMGYFFYAGFDMTRVKADFTFYEGIEFDDFNGNPVSEVTSTDESDSISATGIIFGGGIEFASDNNRAVFVSVQYSTAKTDDIFFGTEDYKVGVGGLAFMLGVKWFPFTKEP
jgi:opacity protein-like surface antigen